MKKTLVCGAGGFIGGHLVKKLKREGYWVRGVDIKEHEFATTHADEFILLDLREEQNCKAAVTVQGGFDEVYQLAADMGGMGFISTAECEIMRNSALININMVHNGIYMLMQSDLKEPTTIGTTEYTSVEKLVNTVIEVSGKDIRINYVEGPVGVKSRNLNKDKIHSIGWKAEYSLKEGMEITYKWINDQVK